MSTKLEIGTRPFWVDILKLFIASNVLPSLGYLKYIGILSFESSGLYSPILNRSLQVLLHFQLS